MKRNQTWTQEKKTTKQKNLTEELPSAAVFPHCWILCCSSTADEGYIFAFEQLHGRFLRKGPCYLGQI